MKKFGLIGLSLSHSFSKKYFTEKFEVENIKDTKYELYELKSIEEFPALLKKEGSTLCGLNVTIPYKEEVIPYLDALDETTAGRLQAVNVIQFKEKKLIGFNSDYIGFKKSLEGFLGNDQIEQALVLGTGGASKAVIACLEDMNIPFKLVSRKGRGEILSYNELTERDIQRYRLIINTTPLGMFPKVDTKPELPYDGIGPNHYIFDLVYNPEMTSFMQEGMDRGAKAMNGLEMLHGQAEAAWEIWNR